MGFPVERRSLLNETAKLCRLMVDGGLARGAHGNMSCYAPEAGLVCIKASGAVCSALTEDDLVLVSIEGEILSGTRRPSIDTDHHLVVYREVNSVRSIVHTHSPYASAFAALSEPIPALVTAIADRFGTEIPCIPYQPPGTDLGALLAFEARGRGGCLVARHGVFAFGSSPTAAFDSAYAIEECAKTCFLARQMGKIGALSENEIREWNTRYMTRYGQG